IGRMLLLWPRPQGTPKMLFGFIPLPALPGPKRLSERIAPFSTLVLHSGLADQFVHLVDLHQALEAKPAHKSTHQSIFDAGLNFAGGQYVRLELFVQTLQPRSHIYTFANRGVIK